MDFIREIVNIVSQYHEVSKIILFGSRACNEFRENSDYDLCIVVDTLENKALLMKDLLEYMNEHKIFIHPYIYLADEYISRIKYSVFKNNLIKKGKVIYNRL